MMMNRYRFQKLQIFQMNYNKVGWDGKNISNQIDFDTIVFIWIIIIINKLTIND
jgi:hypothetical protein